LNGEKIICGFGHNSGIAAKKPFFHKVLKALPKKKYSLFIKKNEA